MRKGPLRFVELHETTKYAIGYAERTRFARFLRRGTIFELLSRIFMAKLSETRVSLIKGETSIKDHSRGPHIIS